MKGRLRDLFELRAIFEPQAAALACRRATEEETAGHPGPGAAVEACIRAGEDRTRADRAFHTAIVRATHNEFMMRLLPIINQAVEAAMSGGHTEQLAEDTLRDHALLMDFFRKRDGAGRARHGHPYAPRHGCDGAERVGEGAEGEGLIAAVGLTPGAGAGTMAADRRRWPDDTDIDQRNDSAPSDGAALRTGRDGDAEGAGRTAVRLR